MKLFGTSKTWGRSAASASVRDGEPITSRPGFDSAVLPHIEAAYNYACYLSRDRHAADDIVQDALLRALRSFDSLRGDSGRAWLLAIVRNCFFSSIGGRGMPASDAGTSDASDPGQSVGETPETIVTAWQEAAHLRDVIATLPQPFREVLILRELEELTYREIALVIEAPTGTVMSRLARARQMLAAALLDGAAASESLIR